jgi:predicted RNA-binding protein
MALISLLAVIALVFVAGVGLAADQVTVTGTVDELNQLVGEDGNTYKIAETEDGMKVMDMVGEKVEVRGTVTEQASGPKEITVESFNIIKP